MARNIAVSEVQTNRTSSFQGQGHRGQTGTYDFDFRFHGLQPGVSMVDSYVSLLPKVHSSVLTLARSNARLAVTRRLGFFGKGM
jgi:hypothetical protein